MAKKSDGVSAFDELLESISKTAPEDRELFSGLADRHPVLRESVLRQSDYSRAMNDMKEQVSYGQEWKQWKDTNWDEEHGMTKTEYALQQEAQMLKEEKEAIERRLALNPNEDPEVDLIELKKQLEAEILGKVNATVAAKEKEFNDRLNSSNGINMRLTLDTARLLMKHKTEFGEELDPDALLKSAVAKGRSDLNEFYDQEYAQPKRIELERRNAEERVKTLRDEYEHKLLAQQKEFEDRAAKMKGMGEGGATPSEATPSEMGAFQRKLLGLDESTDGKSKNGVPDKAVLGSGMIAHIAARNDFEKAAGRL